MHLMFFETRVFTELYSGYLNDREYHLLQLSLLGNPEIGDVMPGTGGFRKMRWQDPKRGKGKRGGLRIIYYYFESDSQVWFFTIYDKNEITDLTDKEKKILKLAVQKELKARRK